MKLIVSSAASADLERLREFLQFTNPNAAQRAVKAVGDAARSLIEFPQRGRPIGVMGIRELAVPFGRSAYVLRYFYSAAGDTIVILRIWHGRENRE